MITLQSYRQEKVLKPSTIYAKTEVYTSAPFSDEDLNEEATEEERIAESKILRRNEQIRLKKTKLQEDKVEEAKEEEEQESHKSVPSFKTTFPFSSLKPFMKNFHIIDKRRNETINHI